MYSRLKCFRIPATSRTLRPYSDFHKPFPPPQPTRPIDTKEDKLPLFSTSSSVSSTFDAVVEDAISHKKEGRLKKNHPFDTYLVLTQLEQQGFTRGQAEAIMKGIKFKLRECTASVNDHFLLNSDLENESYLFKAALSELRTEIQVLRRNDMQHLQTELSLITREVDMLEQNLNESIANMRNDIQLDMNNRKNETKEDQKVLDMKIQEINNKFIIRLGDIRTEIEAVRWETIWKGLTGITVAALSIASLAYLLKKYSMQRLENLKLKMENDKRREEDEKALMDAAIDAKLLY
ncbi:hypothetical protein BDB01DRAFT_728582 [Pilobolus umbonatus]|nr:hypothetical protein BDB01DRAFT_728582 [Pilobolus umbonatus]